MEAIVQQKQSHSLNLKSSQIMQNMQQETQSNNTVTNDTFLLKESLKKRIGKFHKPTSYSEYVTPHNSQHNTSSSFNIDGSTFNSSVLPNIKAHRMQKKKETKIKRYAFQNLPCAFKECLIPQSYHEHREITKKRMKIIKNMQIVINSAKSNAVQIKQKQLKSNISVKKQKNKKQQDKKQQSELEIYHIVVFDEKNQIRQKQTFNFQPPAILQESLLQPPEPAGSCLHEQENKNMCKNIKKNTNKFQKNSAKITDRKSQQNHTLPLFEDNLHKQLPYDCVRSDTSLSEASQKNNISDKYTLQQKIDTKPHKSFKSHPFLDRNKSPRARNDNKPVRKSCNVKNKSFLQNIKNTTPCVQASKQSQRNSKSSNKPINLETNDQTHCKKQNKAAQKLLSRSNHCSQSKYKPLYKKNQLTANIHSKKIAKQRISRSTNVSENSSQNIYEFMSQNKQQFVTNSVRI